MESSNHSSSWFQRSLFGIGSIWLVACTGIALSIATFWVTNHQLTIHKQLDFKWAGQNRYRAFQKELGDSLGALDELRTLLVGVPNKITQENFQLSSVAIMSNHEEILSFAWIPHGSREKQKEFLQKSRDTGEQWGWEHLPSMKPYLEKASTSGEMVASIVRFDNNQGQNTLFAVFLVVYPGSLKPTHSTVRQITPLGYVVGIYQLDQIVTASLDPLEPRGIDIWIQDPFMLKAEKTLFHYASRLRGQKQQQTSIEVPPISHELKVIETIKVADREWTFTALANPLFRSSQAFNEGPWILLIEGIVFTAVLILYLIRLQSEMRKRMRVSQALKESEEQFRNLLDHSPDIVTALDKRGQTLFINRPFPNASINHEIGAEFINLLPPSLHRKYRQVMEQALSDKEVKNWRFSMPDFSWWDARVIPIDLDHGEVKVMLIISDVTQDRMLHAQAIRNARLASLGVLAASVAHEINNPNSAIQFNNAILMRTWGDIPAVLRRYSDNISQFSLGGMPAEEALEAIPRLMAGIERSTSRIKKIVGNLKHMARQDKGGMEQEINMGEVIQAAISILQNQVKKYTDFCHLDPDMELPVIRGNAQQLEQVIINILLNALQSLPDRSRRVLLATAIDETKENILITIHDEGVGMEEETMKNILDPFFTTKETTGGTGLGLSISSDIICNHGGKISFDSKVGEGTLVTIRLPIIPSVLSGLQT
ncbi:MAG: PAS domain S-box protein [Magnetococcales bacterium]|nr:PAS domain S-box protein [Magnetococcales bacterium]